jgi:hypothetical protein
MTDVPPEIEWFANLRNRSTRRAYENAIQDFMLFTGIARPQEFLHRDSGPCHRMARTTWPDASSAAARATPP